jgi:Pyruvate/2-oxoacid:ferredoxin oxidoreductase delta subunit
MTHPHPKAMWYKRLGMFLLSLSVAMYFSMSFVPKLHYAHAAPSAIEARFGAPFGESLRNLPPQPAVTLFGALGRLMDAYNAQVVATYGMDEPRTAQLIAALQGDATRYHSRFLEAHLAGAPELAAALHTYTGWMMDRTWESFDAFERTLRDKIAQLNRAAIESQGFADGNREPQRLELFMPAVPKELRTGLWAWCVYGLGVLAGLVWLLPDVRRKPGIHHTGIYHRAAQTRKWPAWLVFTLLVCFYIVLYQLPALFAVQAALLDPLAQALSGGASSQWFMYGFIYTIAMLTMGLRMLLKYRGNAYQQVRTGSVLFFQVVFAFLLPQILTLMQLPSADLKNMWPLDYTFFFDYRVGTMLHSGTFGLFLLGWGIALFAIGVPLLTYFYGKRWYCSWVCGCGGLAETVGDPYRHLSDKSLKAWKVERWLVHGVLLWAVAMTVAVAYTTLTGQSTWLGIDSYSLRGAYGFWIGFVFAGALGTGFYPVMGNRVWCRFGCPLAAYLGLVQRFKSRFRITTNGGQCISCGNCSTYCEMGIDVKWYAQRGQNIVRSSCVGCGVCSAVCPRGVLRLENGPTQGRINDNPILIGRDEITLNI